MELTKEQEDYLDSQREERYYNAKEEALGDDTDEQTSPMNPELKTLRDFDNFFMKDSHMITFGESEVKRELKKEAIKWVKALRRNKFIETHKKDLLDEWIKEFFNINKEDLENE